MQSYLLSIYQPDGPPPPDVDLAQVTAKLERLNADIKAAGAWVFTAACTRRAPRPCCASATTRS